MSETGGEGTLRRWRSRSKQPEFLSQCYDLFAIKGSKAVDRFSSRIGQMLFCLDHEHSSHRALLVLPKRILGKNDGVGLGLSAVAGSLRKNSIAEIDVCRRRCPTEQKAACGQWRPRTGSNFFLCALFEPVPEHGVIFVPSPKVGNALRSPVAFTAESGLSRRSWESDVAAGSVVLGKEPRADDRDPGPDAQADADGGPKDRADAAALFETPVHPKPDQNRDGEFEDQQGFDRKAEGLRRVELIEVGLTTGLSSN